MQLHKLRSYVLPFAIVVGLVFHRQLVSVREITPYLIFTILLLNNVAVDMKKLKVTMLDVWIMVFQIVVSLGSYFLFKAFGASELVAQGVLVGVLCPVAASSVVIATMLGANRETVTTYTIVGNLMVAIVAPIYFSFIGTLQDLPFLDSVWLIFRRIAPTIALPFFAALFLQRFLPGVNDFLCRYKGLSFYLWAAALTITLGQTIDFMFLEGQHEKASILIMGIASVVYCAIQFAVGKWLGSRYGDRIAGGQILAQKNSAMGIWIANTYLLPLASVFPALYSIWQNLFNSWQLWRKEHNNK
ncbi:MAG: transporter [Bacteroidales bacterium]|nr:transporter [Bacteroidales bacterium]